MRKLTWSSIPWRKIKWVIYLPLAFVLALPVIPVMFLAVLNILITIGLLNVIMGIVMGFNRSFFPIKPIFKKPKRHRRKKKHHAENSSHTGGVP